MVRPAPSSTRARGGPIGASGSSPNSGAKSRRASPARASSRSSNRRPVVRADSRRRSLRPPILQHEKPPKRTADMKRIPIRFLLAVRPRLHSRVPRSAILLQGLRRRAVRSTRTSSRGSRPAWDGCRRRRGWRRRPPDRPAAAATRWRPSPARAWAPWPETRSRRIRRPKTSWSVAIRMDNGALRSFNYSSQPAVAPGTASSSWTAASASPSSPTDRPGGLRRTGAYLAGTSPGARNTGTAGLSTLGGSLCCPAGVPPGTDDGRRVRNRRRCDRVHRRGGHRRRQSRNRCGGQRRHGRGGSRWSNVAAWVARWRPARSIRPA